MQAEGNTSSQLVLEEFIECVARIALTTGFAANLSTAVGDLAGDERFAAMLRLFMLEQLGNKNTAPAK